MKITVVNSTNDICGVHQYGYQIAKCLYKKYPGTRMLGLNDVVGLMQYLQDPDEILIFNWHTVTLSWLNEAILNDLRNPTVLIEHNYNCGIPKNKFSCVVAEHPDKLTGDNSFLVSRPFFDVVQVSEETVRQNTIGFSGFIFPHKGLYELAMLVSAEFENATLRIHGPPYHQPNQIYISCLLDRITSSFPNLKIEYDGKFYKDKQEIVNFLSTNTINIFPYMQTIGGETNGISSSLDVALAARRPIGITRHPLFRHIYECDTSFLIFENKIKDIISMGTFPLRKFYEEYSEEKFFQSWDVVLQEAVKRRKI